MYWLYKRNLDEYRFVLYREVFFVQSVLYQRFHCTRVTKSRTLGLAGQWKDLAPLIA